MPALPQLQHSRRQHEHTSVLAHNATPAITPECAPFRPAFATPSAALAPSAAKATAIATTCVVTAASGSAIALPTPALLADGPAADPLRSAQPPTAFPPLPAAPVAPKPAPAGSAGRAAAHGAAVAPPAAQAACAVQQRVRVR